jgi:hypothetical protein
MKKPFTKTMKNEAVQEIPKRKKIGKQWIGNYSIVQSYGLVPSSREMLRKLEMVLIDHTIENMDCLTEEELQDYVPNLYLTEGVDEETRFREAVKNYIKAKCLGILDEYYLSSYSFLKVEKHYSRFLNMSIKIDNRDIKELICE